MVCRFVFLAASLAAIAFAIAACGGGGVETPCAGSMCSDEQVCVDYVTDGGNGTQCMMRPECDADDCSCILARLCNNQQATCVSSDEGTHVSNCIVSI